jgi:4'-phosphopantetheinyl transferase
MTTAIYLSQYTLNDIPLEWQSLLSPEEQTVLSKISNLGRQKQFIGARVLLKKGVAQLLSLPEKNITLSYTKKGKPCFPNLPVEVSVSHSGDQLILAFCESYPIGIDIEKPRSFEDLDRILERVATATEKTLILAAEDPLCAFFELWTRKEALSKALGEGLHLDFSSFAVMDEKGNFLPRISYETHHFSLEVLPTIEGFYGALALEIPYTFDKKLRIIKLKVAM